jgi:DNA-binding LacI/PurR family transcriptional regulator
MPNQSELSALLNISQGTVSRALRGSGRVSPELRARVAQAARRIGYGLPKTSAPRKARARRAPGVFCVEILNGDAWHEQLIGGAVDAVRELGREVIVAPHRTGDFPQVVTSGKVAGLVRLMGPDDYRAGVRLVPAPVPTVSILFPAPGADVVSVDHFASAYALGLHLGALRPGIVACLGNPGRIGRARFFGLLDGLQECGVTLSTDLVRMADKLSCAASMPMVDELLELRAAGRPEHQFTLIVFYNDFLARHAVERIRARGLRVPEDIGVAGYDDVDPAPSSDLRLTTVHLPIRELGMSAVRRLHARLQRPDEPLLHWLLDTHVVEGNSVRRR